MEEMMNKELMEALDVLEKEKEISKETLFEAIENSLMTACKNHFGKADNVHVEINRETCDFLVYAEKEVVPTKDDVEDDCLQIALEDAQEISKRAQVGDMIHVEIKSKEFGRIATQNARKLFAFVNGLEQLDLYFFTDALLQMLILFQRSTQSRAADFQNVSIRNEISLVQSFG